MENHNVPKVGVGVFIVKNGKILLGKRRGSHGAGLWSLPGGHVEAGEDFDETCRREVKEEVGYEGKGIDLYVFDKVSFSQDFFEENDSHYVTLYFVAGGAHLPDDLEAMEPNKCEEWKWFGIDEIPSPLFCKTEEVLRENSWMMK